MDRLTVTLVLALLLALAASAEAQQYWLVRGAPEYPSGDRWERTYPLPGGQPGPPGPASEVHRLSPGRIASTWQANIPPVPAYGARGCQYDLQGEVAFEVPPERIELDRWGRQGSITLSATGRFQGWALGCGDIIALQFFYHPILPRYWDSEGREYGRIHGNYSETGHIRSRYVAGNPPQSRLLDTLSVLAFETSEYRQNTWGETALSRSGRQQGSSQSRIGISVPLGPGGNVAERVGERVWELWVKTNHHMAIVFPYTLVAEGGGPSTEGYYVYRQAGSGYRKMYGGSSTFSSGYHLAVMRLDPARREIGWYAAPPRPFSEIFAELARKSHEDMANACRGGPRPCPCAAGPNIWATGPTFEIVGGPYRTRQEAVNAHGCDRQDGGRICVAWSSESQPYREADRTCAERR